MSHPNPCRQAIGSKNGNGDGHDSGKGQAVDTTLSTAPFPASTKVHVQGALPNVRVAMREIRLTPTKTVNGGPAVENRPITVYDTSGPYTDPAVTIDIRAGLAPYRRTVDSAASGCARTPRRDVGIWTDARGRSQVGRTSVSAYSQAASRQARTERDSNALCAKGHHHSGNGISSPSARTNP